MRERAVMTVEATWGQNKTNTTYSANMALKITKITTCRFALLCMYSVTSLFKGGQNETKRMDLMSNCFAQRRLQDLPIWSAWICGFYRRAGGPQRLGVWLSVERQTKTAPLHPASKGAPVYCSSSQAPFCCDWGGGVSRSDWSTASCAAIRPSRRASASNAAVASSVEIFGSDRDMSQS